jgi:hypothetical protein
MHNRLQLVRNCCHCSAWYCTAGYKFTSRTSRQLVRIKVCPPTAMVYAAVVRSVHALAGIC